MAAALEFREAIGVLGPVQGRRYRPEQRLFPPSSSTGRAHGEELIHFMRKAWKDTNLSKL